MEKPFAPRSDPDARRAYTRWHYQQNKEKYKERARISNERKRNEVRSFVAEYVKTHPCIDCGEADPIVLEFDHRADSKKHFNISDAVRGRTSLKRVKEEIAKCDVRCANCHRRKTYRDFGWTHRD